MSPTEAFAEVGNLLMRITRDTYRQTPLSADEWDKWTDLILLLAEKEKGNDSDKRANQRN